MHELSIATSIVEAVTEEIRLRHLPAPQAIVVRVGALSGVLPDALQFSYEAITVDTPLANTKLIIEEIPVTAVCHACNAEFAVEAFAFACPECNSSRIEVIRGEELDIAYLEIEENKQTPNEANKT